jgi:hypothetical protein
VTKKLAVYVLAFGSAVQSLKNSLIVVFVWGIVPSLNQKINVNQVMNK